MTKSLLISTAILSTTLFAYPISAQEAPSPQELAQNATVTRQAVFKLLGFNMGAIIGMARGSVPFDAAVAERNARRMAALAPMIPDVFTAMDTREFDVNTQALPVIWEKADEFAEKANNLVIAANKFADVAAGGDQAATMGGLRGLGGSCGSCHDAFRVDDD